MSTGPIIKYENDKATLFGVYSFGWNDDCASDVSYYAKVVPVLDWINDIINTPSDV